MYPRYGGWGSAILAVTAALLLSVPATTQESKNAGDFRGLLQRGFEFHQHKQYAESLRALRRAWEIDPKDYFVNFLLGVDLLRTGKLTDAMPFLKEALHQRPEEEALYGYLGEVEAGLAHYAEANGAYRTAIQVAPQSAEACLALVDYSLARFGAIARQLRGSRAGLAVEHRMQAVARPLNDASRGDLLRRAAELDGDAPGIWSDLAISNIARCDPAAAHDVERAMAKNPSDLRAWEAEALLAAGKGDWALVTEKLNAIARRSPASLAQTARDWPAGLRISAAFAFSGPAANLLQCVQRGSGGCDADELSKSLPKPERAAGKSAIALFNEQRWEALAALPAPSSQQKQEWYFRGVALARTGDCESAIPALERSLGAHPWSVDGMFFLSWCYARQAGEVEKRIEQAGADPALVHLMRGDVLLRLQGNSQAAIAEYQAALTARPHVGALERLAEAQLGADQMEAALQSAEAALRLDPHSLSATRTLAGIAMQDRNYTVALPYLRQLASADPGDVTTRVQLGTAYAQTGSLNEALLNLAPALKQGYPDQKGSLHYLLGTILRRMGRAAEAAQAFEAARQISDAFQRRSHQERDGRP